MSTPIQRYDRVYDMMERCDDGDYVDYDDHAAALAQRDQRIGELEGIIPYINSFDDYYYNMYMREGTPHRTDAALATPEPRDAGGEE